MEAIIPATISAIVAVAVVVINNHFARPAAKADAAQSVSQAAAALIEPLEKRVGKLEKENSDLREQVKQLTTENEQNKLTIDEQGKKIVLLESENAELRAKINRRGLARK
jgi:peptidoglycan hydrolase CwlO-like protein